MSAASVPSARVAWLLAIFVAVIAAQRVGELILSSRHARRVRSRGAREFGAAHFPLLVAVHVLFLISLAGEVWFLGARPGGAWPLWLVLWLGAQALRYAAIRALGERWNVRIFVIPGAPLVHSGPFRIVRQPNYVAVVIEMVAATMLFGAWRTAIGITALNAITLSIRIRAEDAALRA